MNNKLIKINKREIFDLKKLIKLLKKFHSIIK